MFRETGRAHLAWKIPSVACESVGPSVVAESVEFILHLDIAAVIFRMFT
jgi:hypothetical protein